jgi:hypothetical protein
MGVVIGCQNTSPFQAAPAHPPNPSDRPHGAARHELPAQAVNPPQFRPPDDGEPDGAPYPLLGPGVSTIPPPDPQALKDNWREAAKSSSVARQSSIVTGVAVLRGKGVMAATAALTDDELGTRLLLSVSQASAGSYRVLVTVTPIPCADVRADDEASAEEVGRLAVDRDGQALFEAIIPHENPFASLYALDHRTLYLTRELDGRKQVVVCGNIGLTNGDPRFVHRRSR